MNVSKLKTDDVISFVYYGGSNPGAVRRICVTENSRDVIKGFDIDKRDFRNYTCSVMNSIMVMDNKPLSYFTKRRDAMRIQQKLRNEYGYTAFGDIQLVEDILEILQEGI